MAGSLIELEAEVKSLEQLLARIESGETVPSSELLPYLTLGARQDRTRVNTSLARAYLKSGRRDDLEHASIFIKRAWILSRFSEELLPLHQEIHLALGDTVCVKEAYKRVGMVAAKRGDLAAALTFFNRWQYAYAEALNIDHYEYDFDILSRIEELAEPDQFTPKLRRNVLSNGKIRVAYLMQGATELGSVLVKVLSLLAKYADRTRFETMFFAPESEVAVMESAEGASHIKMFASLGSKMFTAPNIEDSKSRLLAVGRMIRDAEPDILVTTAALANFENYFIASLHPAAVRIALLQGPPPQFAPASFDHAIAWSRHTLMESPVDTTGFGMGGDLPDRIQVEPYPREQFGIPDDCSVILSAGRFVKFQEPRFWQAIVELLKSESRLYYLVLGIAENQVPFLSDLLPFEVKSRIRFVGWQGGDYLRALVLADLLIDTFPSGGGQILLEGLALGIPCVSFENDYMRIYDQNDWSPADEFINIPELLVPRWDFKSMNQLILELIRNPDRRRDLSRRTQKYVEETRGHPDISVRKCEDVYINVLEERLSQQKKPGSSLTALARIRRKWKSLR